MEKLTAEQLVALVVRLFAVGLVVYIVRVLSADFALYRSIGLRDFVIYIPFALVLPAFVAAFLWRFPLYIARRLVSPASQTASHADMSVLTLYTIGFVLLGFYLLFWTISDTVYWVSLLQFADDWDEYGGYVIGVEQTAAMVATVVEFALSLFLIFGGRLIARWFTKVRYSG